MSSVISSSHRKRLATFVHISDLHIGRIDPATGDAEEWQLATKAYSNCTWLDGLLGHHGRALKELDAFVAGLKRTEPDMRLIVSGDLSRCGDAEELALARSYIEKRIDISPPLQNLVGLRLGQQKLVIPGNHDQWGGTPVPLGIRASKYGAEFPRVLPFVERITLKNGKCVTFIGIDSDADVTSFWYRIPAIGAFQSELTKIQLPAKSPDEFRILLIHHSWEQKGNKLRMADASKNALEHFLCSHQISAMLCGHTHLALLKKFQAKSTAYARDVHELRAGSTSQHDVVPKRWKTFWNTPPVKLHWNANTLLVHRIHECGAAMEWETQTYERGMRGFTPLAGQDIIFPLV